MKKIRSVMLLGFITLTALSPIQYINADTSLSKANSVSSKNLASNDVAQLTSIKVHDIEIYTGDSWKPKDNFDNAMVNGSLLDYDSFIGSSGTVDTNLLDREGTPGIYSVTYKLNGVESVAKVTVLENQLSIIGRNVEGYVGDAVPEDSEFKAVGLDYDGASLPVVIDKSRINMNKAGNYVVFLTIHSVVRPGFTFAHMVSVNVKEKQTAVKSHDSTIYVGDTWKAQDNFDSAVDKAGHAVDFSKVDVDDSKVNTSKAGIYDVTYSYDGAISTSKVTVKDSQLIIPNIDLPLNNKKSSISKAPHRFSEVKSVQLNKSSLPETGEESGVVLTIYGLFIVVAIGAAILYKKKV